MKEPSPYEILQKIDDARLDVSATRLLVHYWRVGVCWETVNTTHEKTGMSIGSVHKWRGWLLDNGYIELAPKATQNGMFIGYQLRLDALFGEGCTRSHNELIQQCNHSLYEQAQQNGVADIHLVNGNFHEVNALPLSMLNEDSLSLNSAGQGETVDGNKKPAQIAWEAIVDLIEFWEGLTREKHPARNTQAFEKNWLEPFRDIWKMCGQDVNVAKARIQAVRQDFIARDMTIFDPAKLPKHVQTLIDRELIPMTERMNGKATAQPAAILTQPIVNGLY